MTDTRWFRVFTVAALLACLPFLCLAEGPKSETVVNTIYTPPSLDKRPPGLPGLMISEVTVTGVAGTQQERVAILKGIDNASYLARKGSKLYDGYLSVISPEEVVFVREMIDEHGAKKTVKVVKRLYTEDK
jgi:hypothetical protein